MARNVMISPSLTAVENPGTVSAALNIGHSYSEPGSDPHLSTVTIKDCDESLS